MFKIWHSAFSLYQPGGETEKWPLRLPQGPACFPDILPAVRDLADVMVGRGMTDLAALGRPVTCGKGCSACCSHLVVVGQAEALRLADVARQLPEPGRSAVLDRFRTGVERLEEAGLLAEMLAVFTREAHDWRSVGRMQRAYWELAIACPFLEDGCCSIYEERPLVCRQYMVSTAPENCTTPFGPETYIEKALLPLDLAGAAAAFDGRVAEHSRVLPLLLCLLREPLLRRRRFPEDDPHAMLLRFLDLVALGYARKENKETP